MSQYEIDLIAVRRSGHNLQYVKEQTPEICIEAIRKNISVLRYVKINNETVNNY